MTHHRNDDRPPGPARLQQPDGRRNSFTAGGSNVTGITEGCPGPWRSVAGSGFLGDRGGEPGSLVRGETTDGDALAVDLYLDVLHPSLVPAGFDEVDELLRQVDGRVGELDDGQDLGQPDPRLLNLDKEGLHAAGVLEVGLQLGSGLRPVRSGFKDAVNDYLSH